MACDNCGQPYEGEAVQLVAADVKSTDYVGIASIKTKTEYSSMQPFVVSVCPKCLKHKERKIRLIASIILPAYMIAFLIISAIISNSNSSMGTVFSSMGNLTVLQMILMALYILGMCFIIPWAIYSIVMHYRKKHKESRERFVVKRFKKAVAENMKEHLGREGCFVMGLSDWLELCKHSMPQAEKAGSAAAIDKEQ